MFSASYGGPANLAKRLNQATTKWTGSGELEFLNDWTYKLGEESGWAPYVALLLRC
jgi:hypothetical protein